MDLYVIRISNTSVLSLALLVINLIIDTGSSHTWVGAERPYVRTQTSVHTYNAMVSTVVMPKLIVRRRLKPMC
jgi:hypothetical protein